MGRAGFVSGSDSKRGNEMSTRILPRLLAAAAALTGLVVALTLFAGSGFAEGSAAQDNYAPTVTAPPVISGTPQVGQTLTTTTGSWTAQSTPTFQYVWLRCDSGGNNCATISGAGNSSYVVQSADVGHTIRAEVIAHLGSGSTSSTSNPTAAVPQPGPSGSITLPNGKVSIPASSVALPNRLVIDGVQYQPTRLTSRAAFLARFHVSDSQGHVVRDALVYALGLPYSWVKGGSEVATGQDGWANVTITPTAKLPLSRGHALVVFVRARVKGQDVLGGTSTRRLTQVTTAG
jgi:Ig domain of plant-specific actin-binding protein